MVIDILLFTLAGIGLLFGTITDLKTREVPDWLNFSLIFAGLGIRLITAVGTGDWMFLLAGIFGFIVFAAVGYLMYYAGQWGGGDSKMLMGLGALIGIPFSLTPIPLLVIFLFNSLLVGSVYGLIYSIVLAVQNKKAFLKKWKEVLKSDSLKRIRKTTLFSLLILIVVLFFIAQERMTGIPGLIVMGAFLFLMYMSIYLIAFVKAVEGAAMIKHVAPEVVTEGDWIAEEIKVNGKVIAGPKDLGATKAQLKKFIALKKAKKLKTIPVKYGMPFVPSFLVAYVLTLLFGAWWMLFL